MKPTEAHLKRAREFWHAQSPSIATIAQLIADVEDAAGERCAVAYAVAIGLPDAYAKGLVAKLRAQQIHPCNEAERGIAAILTAARGQ